MKTILGLDYFIATDQNKASQTQSQLLHTLAKAWQSQKQNYLIKFHICAIVKQVYSNWVYNE